MTPSPDELAKAVERLEAALAHCDVAGWDGSCSPHLNVKAADLRALLADYERLRASVQSGAWAQACPTMRWAQVQRLRFIAHLLESQGHVNRADLVRKFNISTPCASVALRDFMKWNPGKMAYDATAKTYVFARAAWAAPVDATGTEGRGLMAHMPSQEWLDKHIETDPDVDVEARGPAEGRGGAEADREQLGEQLYISFWGRQHAQGGGLTDFDKQAEAIRQMWFGIAGDALDLLASSPPPPSPSEGER